MLLLMDGASSHYCPEMIRIAAKEQIILFVLPPHTTQICQPLDKGVFASLKTSWRGVCNSFMVSSPGRVVTRYDFSGLFCQAWDNCMTIKNIKAGFRVTGVYPLNKSAIALPEDDFQQFKPHLLPSTSGISYIPLYSSSPFQTKPSQEEYSLKSESEDDENSFISYTQPIVEQKIPAATPAKPLPYISSFEELLKLPEPPSKIPTKHKKSCGRCLTSEEAIAMMEEKEKEKLAVAALKEERKRHRETKRQQQELLKATKKG